MWSRPGESGATCHTSTGGMHPASLALVDRPHVTMPGDPFATWFGALTRWQPAHAPVAVDFDPSPPVAIGVLGELDVSVVGASSGDGLRRARVRTLLELLVLVGPIRRERLADLMWRDLDPDAAAANLRVTLSRLRAVVGGDVVLADSQRVWIDPASRVKVDLWDFEADVAIADAAEQLDDTAAVGVALNRACARWRGDPLADLDTVDGVAPDVESVRRRLIGTALRLAMLCLSEGSFDAAARWGERVRTADPYDERAHRVVMESHIGRGDRGAARDAARRTIAALDELGVDPEPETVALLRLARVNGAGTLRGPRTGQARDAKGTGSTVTTEA